jgi:hypothetical protein
VVGAGIVKKTTTTMVGTDQKVADHATNVAEVRTMAAQMMITTIMSAAMSDSDVEVADLTEDAVA